MDRTACVDVPGLPLQLLLRRRPDWRGHPVAIVDSDRPQGRILHAERQARARGILPGLRYAQALSLAPTLRASVVPDDEIARGVAELAERLHRLTPHVEPCADEPGTLWLDARGLERLWASLDAWAADVAAAIAGCGLTGTVVVGFDRFASRAVARGSEGVLVLPDAAAERRAARAVPLERLGLPPRVRDVLTKLGIGTLGGLADLPEEGLARRFDPSVRRIQREARGVLHVPLQPQRPDPPERARVILDHPESDAARILARLEEMIPPLVAAVSRKGRALAELQVGFRFDRLGEHVETVRPASATRSAAALCELVRLRLEGLARLPDAVVELLLLAGEIDAAPAQATLPQGHGRDLAAANRGLARVRARLGGDAVVRAALRDGHLPEAQFGWEPLAELAAAEPHPSEPPRSVRRIHVPAVALPHRPRHEPDGWMLRDLEEGPVVRIDGPYVVSGGWWARAVQREYHFAQTRDGELLWLYYDRPRRRWYLQGRVE